MSKWQFKNSLNILKNTDRLNLLLINLIFDMICYVQMYILINEKEDIEKIRFSRHVN